MATGSRGDQGAPKAKARTSSTRNIIGLVLLVLCVGATIVEVMASQGYNNAVSKLALTNATMPTKSAAEKIIGKSPDGPLVAEGTDQIAKYTGQGIRGKYLLKVYYNSDKDPTVIRLETERP